MYSCGVGDSYVNRIMVAGFDEVYMDIVEAFEYFEAGGIVENISVNVENQVKNAIFAG